MIKLHITGTQDSLLTKLETIKPGVSSRIGHVSVSIDHISKREIRFHEAALLHVIAGQYNREDANILEIGTAWGWSAAVISDAAPLAKIVTLTPNPNHVKIARRNLANYPNVTVLELKSVDYLNDYDGPMLDMMFIDGDHVHVKDDLPWYNWLLPKGCKLHHDYSPDHAPFRPVREVYDACNEFAAQMHPFDIVMVSDTLEGMVGWYRGKDEIYRPAG